MELNAVNIYDYIQWKMKIKSRSTNNKSIESWHDVSLCETSSLLVFFGL